MMLIELHIILSIKIDPKKGIASLFYTPSSGSARMSRLVDKFKILDSKETAMAMHAARRLGLYLDDQIVAAAVPRLIASISAFTYDFTSFRKKDTI